MRGILSTDWVSKGRLLVDMHGPHDHQSLFDPVFQLSILDAFGRHDAERTSYEAAYRALRDLDRQIQELEGPEEGVAEQIAATATAGPTTAAGRPTHRAVVAEGRNGGPSDNAGHHVVVDDGDLLVPLGEASDKLLLEQPSEGNF